jgi:hypothetical protein
VRYDSIGNRTFHQCATNQRASLINVSKYDVLSYPHVRVKSLSGLLLSYDRWGARRTALVWRQMRKAFTGGKFMILPCLCIVELSHEGSDMDR